VGEIMRGIISNRGKSFYSIISKYIKALRNKFYIYISGAVELASNFGKDLSRYSRCWEFYVLVLSVVTLIASPWLVPGIYDLDTPNPKPEPIELNQSSSFLGTSIDVECDPKEVVQTRSVAYHCEYTMPINDSLNSENISKLPPSPIPSSPESDGFGSGEIPRKFNVTVAAERVEDHLGFGEHPYWVALGVRVSPETRGYRDENLAGTPYFDYYIGMYHSDIFGEVNIEGFKNGSQFSILTPKSTGVYEVEICLGPVFDRMECDSAIFTVVSNYQAMQLRNQRQLRPFQRLVAVGVLISLVKLWIQLIDRMDEKVGE
jgi:hypothetical protein